MGKTVRQLLSEIGSDELTEWIAYYQMEPWGEERADRRNADLMALTYNLHRGPKAKAMKPQDFMPVYNQPLKTQETILDLLKMHTAANGGKKKKKAK